MNIQQQRPLGQAEAVGAPGRAIIARPDDGVWFDVIPGESATVRVHSGMGGGRYTIMEHRSAPEVGPPLHSHIEVTGIRSEQAGAILTAYAERGGFRYNARTPAIS